MQRKDRDPGSWVQVWAPRALSFLAAAALCRYSLEDLSQPRDSFLLGGGGFGCKTWVRESEGG